MVTNISYKSSMMLVIYMIIHMLNSTIWEVDMIFTLCFIPISVLYVFKIYTRLLIFDSKRIHVMRYIVIKWYSRGMMNRWKLMMRWNRFMLWWMWFWMRFGVIL